MGSLAHIMNLVIMIQEDKYIAPTVIGVRSIINPFYLCNCVCVTMLYSQSTTKSVHLVVNIFIVADVILKAHYRLPGIILVVKTGTAGLTVLMPSNSQRVPEDDQHVIC